MSFKIFEVEFEPIYPVGCCLIIAAKNKKQAEYLADRTILHTKEFTIKEVSLDIPQVVIYNSGDY